MANRIDYTQQCPKCVAKGKEDSFLGFDIDAAAIQCQAEPPHVFEQIPGEPAPELGELKPEETNKSGADGGADQAQAEPAVLAAEESRLAAISESLGSGSAPTVEAPSSPAESAEIEPAKPSPLAEKLPPAGAVHVSELAHYVKEGEAAILPGGDLLVALRIPEQLATSLQAEAEDQEPPLTVAELIQQRIEDGIFEWYAPTPAAK